jgi:charged multivesicular body protein 2B
LEAEIKKAAKLGNKAAATNLAKQLVRLRKQKDKNLTINSQGEFIDNYKVSKLT